ncbi:DUF1127 domain-containing protein [Roseobacteraceae bacterium S113]
MSHILDHIRPARRSLFPSPLALFALARQRRALRGLDDARLADLGLTRADALEEANRPLWDVPQHWVR